VTRAPIAPARQEELPQILELLDETGLPQDGLESHLSTTLVARLEGRVVGSAALELYGPAALLRSVVVRHNLRGAGLGGRLTEAALELSRNLAVAQAYLLTETADHFFPRFGFRPIPRSEVPLGGVRSSVEFTAACPTSARTMVLDLRALQGSRAHPA
jgi:amino-acid N-acetyltransferase